MTSSTSEMTESVRMYVAMNLKDTEGPQEGLSRPVAASVKRAVKEIGSHVHERPIIIYGLYVD